MNQHANKFSAKGIDRADRLAHDLQSCNILRVIGQHTTGYACFFESQVRDAIERSNILKARSATNNVQQPPHVELLRMRRKATTGMDTPNHLGVMTA